jgi:hypothetical protein
MWKDDVISSFIWLYALNKDKKNSSRQNLPQGPEVNLSLLEYTPTASVIDSQQQIRPCGRRL